MFNKELKIGIIQTLIDNSIAWQDHGKTTLEMTKSSQSLLKEEIRKGFKYLISQNEKPQIVLIPEYSIPNSVVNDVKKYAIQLNCVVIGGLDLQKASEKIHCNYGAIFIPNNWNESKNSIKCDVIRFGKNFYAEEELDWFKKCGVSYISDPITYIIDAGELGYIGVAICADFYDINRFTIYKGRIHHLFIIAFNRDYKSFEFLTEAISRLLLCNVVICNAGKYGSSLAYSPYKKEFKRVIFKSAGANLSTTQLIKIPVEELDEDQANAHNQYQNSIFPDNETTFKLPPGYRKHYPLDENINSKN